MKEREARSERRERGRNLSIRMDIKAYSIKWEINPSLNRTFESLRKAEALAEAHTTKDKE